MGFKRPDNECVRTPALDRILCYYTVRKTVPWPNTEDAYFIVVFERLPNGSDRFERDTHPYIIITGTTQIFKCWSGAFFGVTASRSGVLLENAYTDRYVFLRGNATDFR